MKKFFHLSITNNTDLMVIFQQIYEEFFKNLYKPVWKDIADKRFFQEDQTLENIGRLHNLTKERVRQLEFLIRHRLYDLLSSGTVQKSYSTHYISPASATIPFNSFIFLMQNRDYILFSQVVSIMGKFSKNPIDSYWLKGLMKICGYNFASYDKLGWMPSTPKESVFYRNTQTYLLSLKVRKLKVLLLKEPIKYLTLEKLEEKLQEKSENVECLLGLISNNLERSRAGYRLKINQLFIPDALYRILSETGRVMTRNELIKKMSDQRGGQEITPAILSQDSRFVAVHSCRAWALREWGLKTESVAELMIGAFQKMNKPLTVQEIHALVVKDRPVSKDHIKALLTNLSYKEKFSYFSKGWGLKEWSSRFRCKPRIKWAKIYQNQIDKLLIACLKKGQQKSAREIYEQVTNTKSIKMKYYSFFNRLHYDSKILLSVKNGRKRLYFLRPNYKVYLASETLKERTLKAMIQLLKKKGKIPLRTAITELITKGFYYPTVYKQFSNAKLFRKEPLSGCKKGYVVSLKH